MISKWLINVVLRYVQIAVLCIFCFSVIHFFWLGIAKRKNPLRSNALDVSFVVPLPISRFVVPESKLTARPGKPLDHGGLWHKGSLWSGLIMQISLLCKCPFSCLHLQSMLSVDSVTSRCSQGMVGPLGPFFMLGHLGAVSGSAYSSVGALPACPTRVTPVLLLLPTAFERWYCHLTLAQYIRNVSNIITVRNINWRVGSN